MMKTDIKKVVDLRFDDDHRMTFEEHSSGTIFVTYRFKVKDWFLRDESQDGILFYIHKRWIPQLIKALKEFEKGE